MPIGWGQKNVINSEIGHAWAVEWMRLAGCSLYTYTVCTHSIWGRFFYCGRFFICVYCTFIVPSSEQHPLGAPPIQSNVQHDQQRRVSHPGFKHSEEKGEIQPNLSAVPEAEEEHHRPSSLPQHRC